MPQIMPAIFFGHGNPMNAVMNNNYTEGWRRMGKQTPKPKAILSIPPRIGLCPTLASQSARRRGRFTISVASLESFTRCNTLPRAIRNLHAG